MEQYKEGKICRELNHGSSAKILFAKLFAFKLGKALFLLILFFFVLFFFLSYFLKMLQCVCYLFKVRLLSLSIHFFKKRGHVYAKYPSKKTRQRTDRQVQRRRGNGYSTVRLPMLSSKTRQRENPSSSLRILIEYVGACAARNFKNPRHLPRLLLRAPCSLLSSTAPPPLRRLSSTAPPPRRHGSSGTHGERRLGHGHRRESRLCPGAYNSASSSTGTGSSASSATGANAATGAAAIAGAATGASTAMDAASRTRRRGTGVRIHVEEVRR